MSCAAYTIAKYGMSMCTLGMAEEFREEGVAVNTLWPRTGLFSILAKKKCTCKWSGQLNDSFDCHCFQMK